MKPSICLTTLAVCITSVTHSLQAGELKPTIGPALPGNSVAVAADVRSLLISDDSRLVCKYRFADTAYKPYIEKLCTPSGTNILRDSPHDHVHHHGLMLALAIDGCDFWSERSKQQNGTQRTDSISGTVLRGPNSSDVGRIRSHVTWVKTDGKPIAVEDRQITVSCPDSARATLLTWRSVLNVADGVERTSITGSHYFGLGMRFVESMDKDGTFLFGDSKASTNVRGDERVTLCRWAAYSAKLDGKPVTVALFAHPKNPRPLYAFTMGDKSAHFAYLAGTINAYRHPLEMTAGTPITLCWGVAVFDGTPDTKQIEAEHARWLKMAEK